MDFNKAPGVVSPVEQSWQELEADRDRLVAENRQLRELLKERVWQTEPCINSSGVDTGEVFQSCTGCGFEKCEDEKPEHKPGCIFLTLFPEEKAT